MKNQNATLNPAALEALQARYALRLAARLDDSARELPHDVTERLKASREQALERARLARRLQAAPGVVANGGGTAILGFGSGKAGDWWLKLASVLPIVALVAGFVLIDRIHLREQIATAAEIDAALLSDDVPPAAYSDPGFVEFLKTPHD